MPRPGAGGVRGRGAALRRLLREHRVDALLAVGESSDDPDLLPFTGRARLDNCFVLTRADGRQWLGFGSTLERGEAAATGLALLAPEALGVDGPRSGDEKPGARLARMLTAGLEHARVPGRRIALAGRYPNGEMQAALGRVRRRGYRLVSGHELALRLRRHKSAGELAEIRGVAAATCAAFRDLASVLAGSSPARRRGAGAGSRRRAGRGARAPLEWRGEGVTVRLLRARVAACFAAAGLEEPAGNLIAPGAEGAVPHNTGDPASVLHLGESLIVDLFPRRRLHADCTRTFCVGEPSAELAAAHQAVLEALVAARKEARAGVRGFELQRLVCARFEQHGYPTPLGEPGATRGYVHGLGHGVGYEVHELPHFRAGGGADGTLEPGDVFTLEPGLYDPAAGYAVRLEDLCLLGRRGVENLTPLPYDLDPRAWTRRR